MNTKSPQLQYVKVGVFLVLGFYFASISHNPSEWHFLDAVNLIFHEAGHAIFFFLGDFVQMAGGTIMQVLVPASVTYYFYKRKQYFSACVILFWVGQSFVNVSVYAGDAIAMQLPLLGGENVIHDWNYLLSSLNILSATPYISEALYLTGFVIYIVAFYFGIHDAVGNENRR